MTSLAFPTDPLGYDVYVREDIDEDGRDASGLELTQNAILHRVTTDKLFLTDAPTGDDEPVEFGEDVRKWVGEALTQDAAQAKTQRLIEVIGREPNLNPSSITVDIQVQPAGAEWSLIIDIATRTTTEVPVALTIGVDQVTVELLSQGR
jgi:hypothetical protein